MSVYRAPPERRRFAAFVQAEFPVAAEAPIYDQLDTFAGAFEAELRVVHTVVADPREQPRTLRHRFGSGLFVPQDPLIHRNDVEHVRGTLQERFDELVEALRGIAQSSAPALIVRPEFQEALSVTRWLRGWAPDLILSIGLEASSLQGLVAAQLLAIPRILVLDAPHGATALALLLPWHAQQATCVVATNAQTHGELAHRFGEVLRNKLFLCPKGLAPTPELVREIAAVLDRPREPDLPSLGPDAAFVTRPTPAPARCEAQAFLVLGAARSGSNMLLSMLTSGHERLTCAGELFNPREIDSNTLHWLPSSRQPEPELLRIRRARPGELHARLLREAKERGAEQAGFELLYYHGVVDDRVIDSLVARPNLAVIHLTRQNRLARWLSMAKAMTSDRWMMREGEVPPTTPREQLDVRDTITDFARMEMFESRYRAVFRHHAVCEVTYEELTTRPEQAARRLGDLLHLEFGALSPRTLKTGLDDLRLGIENFDEMVSTLAGTRWAKFTAGEDTDE